MDKRTQIEKGFTLIELMVVLIIMSIFAGTYANQIVSEAQEDRLAVAVGEINDLFQSAQNFAANNVSVWPNEGAVCVGAIGALTGAGYLQGFNAASPFQSNYTTTCTLGAGKRFSVSLNAGNAARANELASFLPSSTVAAATVTVSVPLPASIPALALLLPLDGTRAMTGDLDMGANDINNVNNISINSVGATAAQGIYFAGIVGNNQVIAMPACPATLTPTPLVVPVGMSDNGTANALGAVYAWAEVVGLGQWRIKLRISVYRAGAWVAMEPDAVHGKLAVYLKCS